MVESCDVEPSNARSLRSRPIRPDGGPVSVEALRRLIDGIFAGFVRGLPAALRPTALDLPRRLRLTSFDGLPWSAVFNNPAVLGLAPMLLADADGSISADVLVCAAECHLMAMLSAFGGDRIDDGQVKVAPDLVAVLDAVRDRRDVAFARLGGDAEHGFARADDETRASVRGEAGARAGTEPVSWRTYAEISLQKQALAFPAIMASARAAGWSEAQRRRAYEVVAGASLGLQFRDDVVDWRDDQSQGGAWPVLLSSGPVQRSVSLDALSAGLSAAGTLVRMLGASAMQFRRAARSAAALGAHAIATWAVEQAEVTERVAAAEGEEPGYAVGWERRRESRKMKRHAAACASRSR